MKCPVCQVELKIADRLGIEIDYCPNCRGVWLDRGELDKIIERVYQEPASSPPPPARGAPPPRRYEDDDDAYDYPERHPHYDPHRGHKRRKKRNWLEDLFDVFD
ncbi:MAG: zf-TFIIB domain-containing protein [Fimbriimonadales bacterium]